MSPEQGNFRTWWRSGAPWIWLNAGAVAISLVVVVGLLALIAARGLAHFWPQDILQITYRTSVETTEVVIGQLAGTEEVTPERFAESAGTPAPTGLESIERWLVKVGNRDRLPADFRWLNHHQIESISTPTELVRVERTEWGDFYGTLSAVLEEGTLVAEGAAAWAALQPRIDRVKTLREQARELQRGAIGRINHQLEGLRLERRSLELKDKATPEALADIELREQQLADEYAVLQQELNALYAAIDRDIILMDTAHSEGVRVPLSHVVEATQPNALSTIEKLGRYFHNIWTFVSTEPREANTEGGVFPAIFGTVMMVLLMSVMVTPFGVIAAVYLREYARQGAVIRLIRIAVNNLAGVPSIVYGVFGLGFFVYLIGGTVDEALFPEALPAPTFGTPGILWASMTLAILTVPVVIVSTEEGLSRIPRAVREGSLALGATKFETLWKVVLPMASPSIMTGVILAIARAAGEVAPLMLVGVVKLAPELPFDGNFPYLHLDRKFMHLGFHIYDVGFQSPNVEAARPLVYATAFLLVAVIIVLNLTVILMRNHLREKYRALEN